MWSDTGKRKYQCTQCYKSCLDSCSFKAHVETHPGEKPFLCISYNMKFSGKGVLNCHMYPHTGEKPYACTGCDKAFSRNSKLVSHIVGHTGQSLTGM